jgi:phosphoglycerate dehydrogenase-like enzyme
MVMNTPGANTISSAQLAFSHMLSIARNIPQGHISMVEGRWDRKKYMGTELKDKTLGLVGCGVIGTQLAKYAQAFGMRVSGFDPLMSAEEMAEQGISKVTSLDSLMSRADFLSLHTPDVMETEDLIRSDTLDKCKRGVFIINCARGSVIDHHDLLAALESGQVGGVALDVFREEPPFDMDDPDHDALLAHERVICTPRIGASTKEAQKLVAENIAEQMVSALSGTSFPGVVNVPFLSLTSHPSYQPYIQLARMMGALGFQLWDGKLKDVEIRCWGGKEVNLSSDQARDLMHSSVMEGVVVPLLREYRQKCENGEQAPTTPQERHELLLSFKPSIINSPHFSEKELNVHSRVSHEYPSGVGSPYSNLIAVTLLFEEGHAETIVGSVSGSRPNVVQIADFSKSISFSLDSVKNGGSLLAINNEDQPGTLAAYLNVLQGHGINIGNLQLLPKRKSDDASTRGDDVIVLLTLDQEDIPEEVIRKLDAIPAVKRVRLIHFPSEW